MSIPKKYFINLLKIFGIFQIQLLRDYERGNHNPRAFNGYCKRALKHEAINAHKQTKRQQLREVTFSDLAPHEENQLYTLDTYFENEASEAFNVAGKKITPKLLSNALHHLPEDKRKAVLLYYFMEMSDVEIAKLLDIPRSTVQYRRTSSFELLKRYLEENADEWDEW